MISDWKEVGHRYHRFDQTRVVRWEKLLLKARPLEEEEEEKEEEEDPSPPPAKRSKRSCRKIDYTYMKCMRCRKLSSNPSVLECGHRFHTRCLTGFREDSMIVCPICRQRSQSD